MKPNSSQIPPEILGPAIVCRGLTRSFWRPQRGAGLRAALTSFWNSRGEEKIAVNEINFSVARGECVGLIGANGAGKTTVLKMLAGLLHPSRGEVEVLGYRPVARQEKFLKSIGMVMGQKSQLWVDIPAAESFELLASVYDVPPAQYRARLKELATLFEVEPYLGVQVRKLSLGERMRLEIIAALLHDPPLLFLDEPTIGLDVVSRRKIREFVRRFNRERGTTVVLTSHDMSDISELCERLLILENGRLRFDGPIHEFERLQGGAGTTRDIVFAFGLQGALSESAARELAATSGAELVSWASESTRFRVSPTQVPELMQSVFAASQPVDVRIEGQDLESLIHQLMTAGK